MKIRHGRYADIEQILEMWRAAGAAPSVTDDAGSLERLMHRDPTAMFVAEVEGTVVGSVIAGWDGWRGNLYRVAVHPSQRRRGVARALVTEAEEHLCAIGCKRISALVLEDEPDANAFWRANGYDPQPEIGRYQKNL